MAKTQSMTRNQKNHDDEASSSSMKRPVTCAPWSDLDHNLLFLVMMQLGVVEFLSFRGVCKSWRSLACVNQNKFMASRPLMHMRIYCRTYEKTCHLEDFEGRRFKTILPHSAVAECVGLTCGYLIFFEKTTRNFWLVNPITRKELHFPDFPMDYNFRTQSGRAILVISPSISGLVFVVLHKSSRKIWFSIAGKGAWNRVFYHHHITDVCAFKGKIYTLSHDTTHRVCQLRLSPEPKLTLLKTKKGGFSLSSDFVSSGENLYVVGSAQDYRELDLDELEWVVPCEKTMREYAFFRRKLNHVIAVKRESWADPRSRAHWIFHICSISPH